jgi:hypothetical protein
MVLQTNKSLELPESACVFNGFGRTLAWHQVGSHTCASTLLFNWLKGTKGTWGLDDLPE